jgi:hypothetical protein
VLKNYFLVAGFFAGAFFAAGTAFAAGFLAATGFAAGALVATLGAAFAGVAFLVVLIFTPAALAALDRLALRRDAVFLLRRCFFTAVSISLCAFERVTALGFAVKALKASLISRLIPTLRSLRLIVCFARLIADLIIGTMVSFSINAEIKFLRNY